MRWERPRHCPEASVLQLQLYEDGSYCITIRDISSVNYGRQASLVTVLVMSACGLLRTLVAWAGMAAIYRESWALTHNIVGIVTA